MGSKKSLKDILYICKDGKFDEVLALIKDSYGEMVNKYAVRFVVSICNACVNNTSTPENISENDLLKLLQFVISPVKYLCEPELLSYLQSIYFIVKILHVKKQYDIISKMQDILFPSFLPVELPSKHKATYQSSGSLLYNIVVTLGTQKDVRYSEALLEISYLISKIYSRLSNPSSLLGLSYTCGSTLSCLGVSARQQEEYYFYVLFLLKQQDLECLSQEDFKCLIKYLTLLYNNILQKSDFEQAAKFYAKAFSSGTLVFQNKDHFHILTLLKLPLILSPLIIDTESLIECKKSLQQLGSISSELLGNKLNTLICTVVSYYKVKDSQAWCEFTQQFQLDLLHFIFDVGQFETCIKVPCPCKCLITKNVYQGFSYLQYICTLLEITIRYQREMPSDYYEKCSSLLIKFCPEVQTLKDFNCEKWKSAWNILGMAIYNIGVHLYQKSDKAALFYFYKLVKYYIIFEGNAGKIISKFSMISSAFTAICSLNASDYKSCMAYAALGMLYCHDQRNVLMSRWIKAKVGQRDLKTPDSEEVQKITLVSAFDKFKTQMAPLTNCTTFLNNADKVNLLTFELEQYKQQWKSKIPMMSALKELLNLADLDTIVRLIVKVFGDCNLVLHDEVPGLIHKVLKQYEAKHCNEKQSESTVFLAVLYHLHYKYCVKDTIIKNTDDMERTMFMAQKTSEPPDAIPKDPNEECDIVSSYESLKLNRYFSVLKYLNNSLNLFASLINSNFDPSCFETVTTSSVYHLLLKIFHEYKLHNHKVRGLQALQLALKLAQLDNEPTHIVQAVSFLVENSDVTRGYVKYLTLLADKQLGNILCSDIANLKIILTYYICKSKAYLYHDYKEAYRIFQTAVDLYELQEDKSGLQIVKCQLLLLRYKFIMLPCKLGIEDHQKNTLLTIHSANVVIYDVYNTSKLDGAYEMSILLDANEELAKLYCSLQQPREVRAYCRETIILTQKLVLPLRCASYLIYLSHADLRSTRYDDCRVKLEGLADILCLPGHNLQVGRDYQSLPVVKLDKEMEDITNDMQEMVLDLPASNNYEKQFCPSSPSLIIESFHLPAFLSHDDSCDCFFCICYEYQELVLHAARLDALINVKLKNAAIATDFFRGSLKLYEHCRKKNESYMENAAKLISYDLIPDLEKELLAAYASVLLDYSYHVMRNRGKTEAVNINNKLIELVSLNKLEHPYLYGAALNQKLGYLMQDTPSAPKLDVQSDTETLGALGLPQAVNLPVTPESKQSKVTFLADCTPAFPPPNRVVKKCLPFDLDEIEEIPKKKYPAKKFPKIPKVKIHDDNDPLNAKTPAKPHIYASTCLRKRNTRQNLANIAFIAPETSTPTVECPAKTESGLKSRTKLLTERLQQSMKTSEVLVQIDDDDTVVQNRTKTISARKNLLSELTESETEPKVSQGAIRKSTRHRN